jgi:hypothetical protein
MAEVVEPEEDEEDIFIGLYSKFRLLTDFTI